ncbi:MAG TPA: hypothetical protein VJR89_39755 [Polyangiales bacterium]|nr:hypothetical protein [Polyangiales bacterium]
MEAREVALTVRAAKGVAGAVLACLWSACAAHDSPLLQAGAAGSGAPDVAEDSAGVHARYELGDGSLLTLGSTPWPDDLYLDRTGRVAVNGFEDAGDASNQSRLSSALKDLDGFGVSTPVYFYFDGHIDAASLPRDEDASMSGQASVFLIDADTGSPDAFMKQPIVVDWQPAAKRLALRPADGHPLTPGRRYAAVLTRRVKDSRGNPIEPAAKFAAVRDPDQLLSDARLSAARAEYTPVLETLVKTGLSRQEICALAVFHVQNVDRDLGDARKLVRAGKPPTPTLAQVVGPTAMDHRLGRISSGGTAGFEESGAAPHDYLYAMVHGTLPSPNLLSATDKTHGAFERDEAAQLRVKRTDSVPFTLFLPRSSLKAPIVIYQHQRDRERSDALALANELASRGLAVLALDAPFSGSRARTPPRRNTVDWRNRFTGEEAPDGFGDAPGDFLGFDAASEAGVPWHPFDARDAMRQTVVDLMVAVRAIEEGSLQAATSAKSELKERTFLSTSIGFIGEDTGASIGVMLARFEPTLQALVLASPGASTISQWAWSATDEPLFETLTADFGYSDQQRDSASSDPAFWPDVAIYQTLFDRADPLAHVAALRRAAVNVLVLMAEDDETVPNRSTEAYSAALGTTLVGSDPRYVYDLMREDLREEGWSGNYQTAGSWVTRTTYVYSPATHDFLQSRTDSQRFVHPPEPPFEPLAQRVAVQNPTAAAARQIGQYLASFFDCVGSGGALPNNACAASPD